MILYLFANILLLSIGTLFLNIFDTKNILARLEKYILWFFVWIAFESFVLFLLAWSQIGIQYGKFILFGIFAILLWINFFKKLLGRLKIEKTSLTLPSFQKPSKEVLLAILLWTLILFKLTFSLYHAINIPSYFDDEKGNWNIKAKAIAQERVISTDPDNVAYLWGGGIKKYPFNFVLYKVYVTDFIGHWSDGYTGSITFIVFALTLLLVFTSFKNPLHGLVASYLILSLPLVVWHAGASYFDLTYTCFYLLSLVFVMKYIEKNESIFLLVIGFLLYSAIFTKNEGMVLVVPAVWLALATIFYKKKKGYSSLLFVMVPLLLSIPHFIFRFIHNLALNPTSAEATYGFHSDALSLFYTYVTEWGSYNIFWFALVPFTIYLYKDLVKTEKLPITLSISAMGAMIAFIFTFSNNYQFLLDQTTINRTLLVFMIPTIYFYARIFDEKAR